MKRTFILLSFILSFALGAKAQGKVEVNPSVQWQFVRTNEVSVETGQLQTFEFPAYKNLDYIVNLELKGDSMDIELFIYDMQSHIIAELDSRNAPSAQMEFGVDANATYQVAIRFKNRKGPEIKTVPCLLSLLKRPRI